MAPSFAATDSPPSPACRARDVGVLYGVYPGCATDVPLENVLVQAEGFLTKSVRVYRYGNNVVLEVGMADGGTWRDLATGTKSN